MANIDPINYILDSIISYHVPEKVLRLTFLKELEKFEHMNYLKVIEISIKDKIILGRVLNDCNLLGGYTYSIPIHSSWIDTKTFEGHWLIKVPMEATSNRHIIHARNLIMSTSPLQRDQAGYVYTRDIINGDYGIPAQPMILARTAFNHYSHHTVRQTSRLEVVGNNLILCTDSHHYPIDSVLECVLEHNDDFTDLSPATVKIIEKACVLALKAYIYNKMNIALDQGYLENGHELTIIKTIVEEYSSAMEDYENYVEETLRKALFFNDKKRVANLISLQLPNLF